MIRNIGVGILLVVAVVIAQWPNFVVNRIRRDLQDYAKSVRASDQPLGGKERLLDVIDALETKLDEGARPPAFGWAAHDEAVKAMLDEGITSDEVRLIERELQKVERNLTVPSAPAE